MAQRNLEPIGVEVIAQNVGSFLTAMKQMEAAYDRTSGKLDQFVRAQSTGAGPATQKMNSAISSLLPSLAGASGGLGGIVSALGPVAAAAGVAVGGLLALKAAFNVVAAAVQTAISTLKNYIVEGAALAGRFQEMDIAALAVGRSMGLQEGQIRGAIEGVHDLGIRYDVAAKSVASFARNQIDLSQATGLVRIAQGAAILMGEDSSATMERLTWAVTTHNTRMMRMMGIMVDFESAQKRWAEANDRDADSLTQVEKNMIAVNETVRAGASVAEIYGEAMKSPTKALRSLTDRELPEMKAVMMTAFMPAWATAINAVRGFVTALTDAMREGGALYPVLVNLGAVASILADAFASALQVATDFISNLSEDMSVGFGDLIVEHARWGAEMVAALAEGIIWAASTVLTAAMNQISATLSWWLGPGSPPKVAPGLIKWGVAAMSEFLHGMTEADFSVLEKIQRPLKQILEGPAFADISAEIIKALSGGEPGEALYGKIAKAAGQFGTEIARLAQLQIQLAQATQQVADAEKRVTESRSKVADLTAEYNEMLRGGAGPAALKAKLAEVNAAEEGLKLAQAQREEAKERIGSLEEEAELQGKVVDQLIGLGKAAAPTAAVAAAGAAAAARGVKAPKAAAAMPELALPTPAQFDISSRISEAIDKAKAVIKEKLAYIFEPLVTSWRGTIFPTIQDLGLRFSEFGLQVLAVWEKVQNFLMPVLERLWNFTVSKLIPKLTELARQTLETLKRTVAAVKRGIQFWLAAMQALWSWVTETFIPFIEEKFVKALELIKDWVDRIKSGFDAVVKAIKSVIEWMEKLIEKAREAAAAASPFLPGSPSPLERGLTGAAKAMRHLATVEVPRFGMAMSQVGTAGAPMAYAGAMTNYNTPVTMTVGPNYIGGGTDLADFQIRVEQAVTKAINKRW